MEEHNVNDVDMMSFLGHRDFKNQERSGITRAPLTGRPIQIPRVCRL
jgi:hypothetical protein